MDEELKKLEIEFKQIKALNWTMGLYSGTSNVGKTFEKLLGIEENLFEIPDYNGIEIKTKRDYSKAYTALFNMSPNGKYYHEIERIKDSYGYPDKTLKEYKVLNNSIYANSKTQIGIKYQFKLKIDRKQQKIFLLIYDKNNNLIEDYVNWDFDSIKEKLYRKMKIVTYISALRKFIDNKEYFKYYKMEIYYLKDFDKFIDLVENGTIRITFKIGIFKDGDRKGQIHDHGTSFDIKKEDFDKLFNKYKTIF